MIYSFSTDLKQHKAIHVQTVTAPLYRRPNTALPGRTASTVAHKRHMHRNAAMLVHAEITGNGGFYTLQQLLKRHALCSLPLFTSHLCSVLRDCNGSRVSYQPMVMSRTCSLLLEAQHRKQPKQEHSPLSPLKRIPETPGPALPRARQARLHGRADRHPHGRRARRRPRTRRNVASVRSGSGPVRRPRAGSVHTTSQRAHGPAAQDTQAEGWRSAELRLRLGLGSVLTRPPGPCLQATCAAWQAARPTMRGMCAQRCWPAATECWPEVWGRV